MYRFLPHILILTALLSTSVAGFVWNVQPIAVFVGTFAAFCTDPLIVLTALLIGALSRKLFVLLLGSVIAGILCSLYIANVNAPLGAKLTIFIVFTRTITILTLALVANAVRMLVISDSVKEPR